MSDDIQIVTDQKAQDIMAAAAPDNPAEVVITEAFITDEGDVVSNGEFMANFSKMAQKKARGDDDVSASSLKVGIQKYIEGSSQSSLGTNEGATLSDEPVVEPPYDPSILATFLDLDETHYRCVRAKTTDSVGRPWSLRLARLPDGTQVDPAAITDQLKTQAKAETVAIMEFVEECNDALGFNSVVQRACMNYEAIGWGALEVIRSRDKKIRRLDQIPAERVKVLRGWKGFVEEIAPRKYRYYQPFGQKVVSTTRKDPITGRPETYNPVKDGPINSRRTAWNFVDKNTGKPTDSYEDSATEVIYVPKDHVNSIYYGIPDIISAATSLLTNVNIREYVLQFFENNTIPRYAIVIEGANMSPDVKKLVTQFFKEGIKGKNHKTLIVPIPATGGQVKVDFKRLDADAQEASFQETYKAQRSNILVAHGVSPAIIGIAEAANLGSGKGLSQAEIYKDRIVTPQQSLWENHINRLFRYGLGVLTVQLEYNDLDIRDEDAESQIVERYVKNGVMTRDEGRERVRVGGSIDGGDVATISDRTIMPVETLDGLAESNQTLRDTEAESRAIEEEIRLRDEQRETEQPTV